MLTWFSHQKVIVKFIALTSLILATALTILISWNLIVLNKVSMDLGMAEAQITGQNYADKNTSIMQNTVASLASLRSIFTDEAVQGVTNRDGMIRNIEHLLKGNESVSSIFTIWEKNAYGRDAEFASHPLYSVNEGRMASMAIRFDDGNIMSVPFGGLDTFTAYEQVKTSKKDMVLEPYNAPTENGKSELLTMIVLPIMDKNDKFLGVIGGAFLLDTFQQSAELEHPLGGNVSLLSSGGLYIANGEDSEQVGKTFLSSEDNNKLFEEVKKGKLTHEASNSAGKTVIRAFRPISITGNESWYVQTVIPKSEILTTYTTNRNESILIGLAALLFLALGIWMLAKMIVVNNIKKMMGTLQYIASGDLTHSATIRSKDEFGIMAEHLNIAVGNLRTMLAQTAETTLTVSATSQELTSSAGETSSVAHTISSSMEKMAEAIHEQSSEVAETASRMEEIVERVHRVASSAEAVSDSTDEVIGQTEQGDKVVQQAIEQMNTIYASTNESNEAMKRLSKRSQEIEKLVDLISGISNQTNLLALNAAVEAARAGEQGKGFAVVAAEVRKLADQTKNAAIQAQVGIAEIAADTEHTAELIANTAIEADQGRESVLESGRLFASIMQEMKKVGELAQSVSFEVKEINGGSNWIAGSVRHVSDIALTSSDEAAQVAAAAEQQLATMQEISNAANHLSQLILDLAEQMGNFKV
ncbi:methyl-accepting chemotaxis protein [Paenibacillus sp. FSL R5-0407]|uniref:methyl-accepting chemotaxis protein n=1 Tax=Paenibacillus TaxID=44249 RepID=UPI0025B652CB|nr:methyl-accepting chemotaxis protein [Paenibacillus vini]MDN4068209.1 methyl-accepting chemotaxis protein [Paenibacillus vini]